MDNPGIESAIEPWLTSLRQGRADFSLSLRGLAGRLRIPSGWEVGLNTLENHLFYYVVEGGFEAFFEGNWRSITVGDLLWCPRGSDIHLRLPPGQSLVIWRFRLEANDESGPLPLDLPYWHLSAAQSCEVWMRQIVMEADWTEPWSRERLSGLLLCLFTEMLRVQARATTASGTLTPAQRETINRYFAAHVAEWPSPAQLAAAIELSPDYFTRCFRRSFGIPPRQWLVQQRMRLAAVHLLESHLRIVEVARELGYEDVFLFSRQFKAATGHSPAEYRRLNNAVIKYGS